MNTIEKPSGEEIELQNEIKTIDIQIDNVEIKIQNLSRKKRQLQAQKDNLETQLTKVYQKRLDNVDWQQKDHPWSQELHDRLKVVFKIKELRPQQLTTINAIMSKEDAILIMPTGGGKSLCYQLPALLLPGVTIVISPLVSLMEDQVMALKTLGVRAVMLGGNGASKKEVATLSTELFNEKSSLKLIYVTPEKLAKSKSFMSKLEKTYQLGRLSLIAIDEVHCCSQWGHDFRPDYKFLGILRTQYPTVPILGLTATAPRKALEDTRKILNIERSFIFKAPLNRRNLFYTVMQKSKNQKEVMDSLADLINVHFPGESGIIYCLSIKECMDIASELSQREILAKPYHAQLDVEYRQRVHHKWASGEVKVVVATIAFGMGINKLNVRFVIHHSLSRSLENYYQESGRAGRDGQTAYCILMYRFADVFRQSTMVFTERTGLEKLRKMVHYAIQLKECRRKTVADHFGEDWTKNDCAEMCDVCCDQTEDLKETNVVETVGILHRILDASNSKKQRLTAQKLLDLLLGKSMAEFKTNFKPSSLPRELWELVIARLLIEGYLKEEFHFTPYNTISYINVGERFFVVGETKEVWVDLFTKKRKHLAAKEFRCMNKSSFSHKVLEKRKSKVTLLDHREKKKVKVDQEGTLSAQSSNELIFLE